MEKRGKVYLVGAGPGDAKLITLRGLECIQEADIIAYDHLVNFELLLYARPEAEIIYVGKRGYHHTVEQEKINQLLVEKAREGKTVTRLKGGDPFIFGRGGEETLVLAENGIPFEVVPGVSSAYAVPAYAGIPLTHRSFASAIFATGREDCTKEQSQINWQKLATAADTLIFLMGVKNLPKIVQELIKHGRAKETPIALIRWGTTEKQQTIAGTLETIVSQAEENKFRPPAVIVVGEVVNLREKLAWFEKKMEATSKKLERSFV